MWSMKRLRWLQAGACAGSLTAALAGASPAWAQDMGAAATMTQPAVGLSDVTDIFTSGTHTISAQLTGTQIESVSLTLANEQNQLLGSLLLANVTGTGALSADFDGTWLQLYDGVTATFAPFETAAVFSLGPLPMALLQVPADLATPQGDTPIYLHFVVNRMTGDGNFSGAFRDRDGKVPISTVDGVVVLRTQAANGLAPVPGRQAINPNTTVTRAVPLAGANYRIGFTAVGQDGSRVTALTSLLGVSLGCSAAAQGGARGSASDPSAPLGAAAAALLWGLGRRRRDRAGALGAAAGLAALGLWDPAPAAAQLLPGFQLNRYQPTAAGEWSFLVDHPVYSGERRFSAGVTLSYAHSPLVLPSLALSPLRHQLIGHVDLAGSFLDRVLVTASLPVTLYEAGDGSAGLKPAGVAAGDPRLGLLARLYGQPLSSPFSLSLGAQLWIPVNSYSQTFQTQVGESGFRVMPKLIFAGYARKVLWSATAAYYYRPSSPIGTLAAAADNFAGAEVQVGGAVSYADTARRFAVGVEALMATSTVEPRYASLDVLVGAHYNIARALQVSAGVDFGAIRAAGTADFQPLLRLAYAPMRAPVKLAPRDGDGDGIADTEDACPRLPGPASADRRIHGCPSMKPAECAVKPVARAVMDRDGDGVPDDRDACIDQPAGARPDAQRLGCPLGDRDGDGVTDDVDQCPDVVAGPHPDVRQGRAGCPDQDSDGDGVFDSQDRCPQEAAGLHADAARPGCPQGDRDHDLVPDGVDACPDKAGAPSADPKKNGCPGKVEVRGGAIVLLGKIQFAKSSAEIAEKKGGTGLLLESLADALKAMPVIKKVSIQGHTDDKGKRDKNVRLSQERAQSVQGWLVAHGVSAGRLEARGFGPDKPLVENKKEKDREKNRRVEFVIVDPPQPAVKDAPTAPDAATDDEPKGKRKGKRDKAKKEKKEKKERKKKGK